MHVAVVGAGSLGSLVGGLLADTHHVTLVGRPDHVRAVESGGLQITGQLDRTEYPAATERWDGVADPDVALVTVKTFDTEAAARAIATAPPATVVTLQNGLGTVTRLREHLPGDTKVLVGTVTYAAVLEAPGRIRCTGEGAVRVGCPDGGQDPVAERLAGAFAQAPIDVTAVTDIPRRRWTKLAVNAAINPVTALARVRNDSIREPPLRAVATKAAHEVSEVARSQGIMLSRAAATEAVLEVAARTAENESSMARDVRRGRRTEVEAITGEVIDRAGELDVPVNRLLYALLRGYEVGAGVRNPQEERC